MDLFSKFQDFIKKENIFQPEDKILLTVSGGIDSVVMTELFHRAQFKFAIAHCNFGLRGKESDADEKFVRALAKKYKLHFYTTTFDTKSVAKKRKLSVQEAARNLRYDWFSTVAAKNKFAYIATAHHLNDNIETFFINLLRGSGISGLTGMLPVSEDEIIRPLLFATRLEIEEFAQQNKIKFCEDTSNATDDYLRNKIRHHLFPVLKKMNPSLEKTMARNLRNLQFAEHVFSEAIVREAIRQTQQEHGMPYFSRKKLRKLDFPVDYLYEFLSPFNFNATEVQEIWDCRQSGKIFYSDRFRVICDRDKILFGLQPKPAGEIYEIHLGQASLGYQDFSLGFTTITLKKEKPFKPPADQNSSCLDASLLKFPLKIRLWKAGDSFFPLGMKHHKKLSDFMIDNKFSVPEKERTYVVISGKDIVCIPGKRIDDRYKVTSSTVKVFRIDYLSPLK